MSWWRGRAGGAHPRWRDQHDQLAGHQQRLLQAPGDLPAVLDRPHPLLVEALRPAQRLQLPLVAGDDLALPVDQLV